MLTIFSTDRLRLVSNSFDGGCVRNTHARARNFQETRREGNATFPRIFARACVYFARHTVAIAKIRTELGPKMEGVVLHRVGILTLSLPRVPKIKIQDEFQISFCKKFKDK